MLTTRIGALQSSPNLTEDTARILADHPELIALVTAWPTLDSAHREAILNAAFAGSDSCPG